MSRFVAPLVSEFDTNGNPLAGAKYEFFEVGTVNQKNTFSDEALTTPNANPVIADASGTFGDIFLNGDYDVTLKTSADVLVEGPDTIREFLTGSQTIAIQELTTATMAANTSRAYTVGDVVDTAEFSTGTDGGATYDVVLTSSVTPNTFNIIIGTADALISFVLRIGANIIPEQWGVIGDDAGVGAANKAAFDLIVTHVNANGGTVYIGPKTYTILGSIAIAANPQVHGIKWIGANAGAGVVSSTLSFPSYVSGQVSGVDLNFNTSNLHLEGFNIVGAGSGVLNDASAVVTGLNQTTSENSPGMYFKDMQFRDWSGDGANIQSGFQQAWVGCAGRGNGQWGIVISGDQAPSFDGGGGQFFTSNGTGGLWIKKGNAFIRGLNLENENIGLKLGVDNATRCKATIIGANLERLNTGSTGIFVAAFSQIFQAQGVQIQGPETNGNTGLYAVYFENMNSYNDFVNLSGIWFSSSDGDGWDNNIYIELAESDSILKTTVSRDSPVTVRAGTIPYVVGAGRTNAKQVRANEFSDDPVIGNAGINNQGTAIQKGIRHTQSIDGSTLDLSAGFMAPIYYLECTGGNITVVLPSGAVAAYDDQEAIFMKIDASANTVTLQTNGTQLINGVNDPVMTAQYENKRLHIPIIGTSLIDLNA